MLHTKFRGNTGPLVPEKKIKGCLPYTGVAAILVM